MENWRKHTGSEMPAELAPDQLIEWRVNDGPVLVDPARSLNWGAELYSGSALYYRPFVDSNGLRYVSAEGLMPNTEYVAKEYDGSVLEFGYKPQYMPSVGEWDYESISGLNRDSLYTGDAPSTHAIPGKPEDSLARVWKEQ